ncbi:MAG: PAS domain S-box protein [Lentisphaeria bacterium]|nr:PAS domain S-box protein [Lentisphaeria bacterium]
MDTTFFSIALAVLEMTFLFVTLLLLHGLKKQLGAPASYVAMGLLFGFTQFAGAGGITIVTGYSGFDIPLSSGVLMLPFLGILAVIYIADGTLSAQRVIIGLMISLALYLYLAHLTVTQAEMLPPQDTASDQLPVAFAAMMRSSLRVMAANVLSSTVDIFLIPIFYQGLRNRRINLFLCVAASLIAVQLSDALVFSAVYRWGRPEWWLDLEASYLFKTLMVLWLSVIITFYISRIRYELPGEGRGALDIVIAFFGNYGRRVELEKTLRDTEERYRVLFRNAVASIFLTDPDGVISEVNDAAATMFHTSADDLKDKSFPGLAGIGREKWDELLAEPEARYTATLPGTDRILELAINRVAIDETPMVLVHGRDVTERTRLEREREIWREQTFHRQRLESIGELAGGIAHDFNNFLQAIQGHLDLIKYMYPVREENARRHIEVIDTITERAATLTRDLLGFARRGNFTASEIDLAAFLNTSAAMFLPSAAGIDFKLDLPDKDGSNGAGAPLIVRGESVQLQQVILNLLMNARDAVRKIPEHDRHITISLGMPAALGVDPLPPPDADVSPDARYCVIRIKDSGPGVPDELRARIFEPFFTTKPVGQGTGMGLSMAYGILISHKGWLQLDPADPESPGAAFSLFLPLQDQAAKA